MMRKQLMRTRLDQLPVYLEEEKSAEDDEKMLNPTARWQ
jgi:hypothetical protein